MSTSFLACPNMNTEEQLFRWCSDYLLPIRVPVLFEPGEKKQQAGDHWECVISVCVCVFTPTSDHPVRTFAVLYMFKIQGWIWLQAFCDSLEGTENPFKQFVTF